jgi:O-antigen/teichoic acid export membrane protein
LLRKILSYGIVEGIAKGLNKLVVLILPFFITTENYGILGLLISIELVLPLLTFLGLERAVIRFYHIKSRIKNFESTVFKSVTLVNISVLSILLIAYVFGIKEFIGLNIIDIILTITLVYFQGSIVLFTNMLRVEEQHNQYYRIRLLNQISKLFLVLFLTIVFKNYYGYLIGSILSSVLILSTLLNKYLIIKAPFNKKTFLVLINFSWPFILHGVSGNLLGNVDKFVVNSFMTKTDLGVYTLAYAIGSSMIFAFTGISIYMEPFIYKAKNNLSRNQLLLKFNIFGLISGLLFYIVICSAFQYIIPFYDLGSYKSIVDFVPYVALGFLLYPFYLSSNWQLIYQKKGMTIAILSIITALINVILNVIFIPKFGLISAVFNSFITYFIQTLLFLTLAQKKIFNLSSIIVLLGGAVIIFSFYLKLSFLATSFLFGLLIFNYYILSKKRSLHITNKIKSII